MPEPALAAEVERVAPDAEIVVAPVPELDDVLQLMSRSLSTGDGGEPSYFEDGRIPAAAIEDLFASAATQMRFTSFAP